MYSRNSNKNLPGFDMKALTCLLMGTLAMVGGTATAAERMPPADASNKSLAAAAVLAGDLLAGEVMAVAYSGFRAGQHPDRGAGAVNPSTAQILEDLRILVAHDFNLIRLYDAGENSAMTLDLIRQHDLPIKVLLGIWLDAEFSNHAGCSWLESPIPDEQLAANGLNNSAEVERGIELAKRFAEIVVAVNVGNEALVEWNDHMVPLANVIAYVRRVRASIDQPVTVADNYLWWIRDGAPLAAEVDFLGVHTYPQWEQKSIDAALAYSIENIEGVRAALPDKPIVVLEAGWASVAIEFGDRASVANQTRYYRETEKWASDNQMTVFFFEAFDEPWKGDPNNPLGAEKHWGLFNLDRTPKWLDLH
jgi:exo-beta-1,3-glucanase (GH17 family)